MSKMAIIIFSMIADIIVPVIGYLGRRFLKACTLY